MALLKVFKSTFPSITYIMQNGKPAIFVAGVFRTAVQREIDELEAEIAAGHPHIFVDPNEKEVESAMLDPMVALETRIREKVLAEIAAANALISGDPARDMGNTTPEPLKPANTQDIAQAAMGGSGAMLTASLKNLKTAG